MKRLAIVLIGACANATGVADLPDARRSADDSATPDAAAEHEPDPTGNGIWIRTAAGTGRAVATNTAIDPSGNIVATGTFTGALDFGTTHLESRGLSDVFVVEYDPAGGVRWARSLGGCGYESQPELAIASDGGVYLYTGSRFTTAACDPTFAGARIPTEFVPGDFTSSLLVLARYGADGTEQWARSYGGARAQLGLGDIAIDGDSLAISGMADRTTWLGPNVSVSPGDALFVTFVAKLDVSGNAIWAHSHMSTGLNLGTLTMNGTQVILNGGLLGAGWIDLGDGVVQSTNDDTFVIAYDATTGAVRWRHVFGGAGGEYPADAALAADGTLWLGGTIMNTTVAFGNAQTISTSDIDGYGAHLDADGNALGVYAIDGGGTDGLLLYSSALTGLVAGVLSNTGGDRAWIGRTGPSGTMLWQHEIGGLTSGVVSISRRGNTVAIGGGAKGPIQLPGLEPVSLGTADAMPFIARILP